MKIARLFLLLSLTGSIAAHGRRDVPYTLIEHQMPLAQGNSALIAADATVHHSIKMFNAGHKKTELFSGFGNAFQNLDPRTVDTMTVGPDVVIPGQLSSVSLPKTFAFLSDFLASGNPTPTLSGKSTYYRVTAHVEKGFDSGIYARLEIPFVEHHIQCTNVLFKSTSPRVNLVPQLNRPPNQRAAVSNETLLAELDDMLTEYGLQPLQTDARERGIGDILAFIGWHGYEKYHDDEITGIRIRLEGGMIIPTGREQEIEKVFAPSVGYNRHIGFMGRVEAGLCAWNMLELGAQMNMTVFLNHRTARRVAVSTGVAEATPSGSGFIYLHKANVDENLGSIWGASAHIKLKPTAGGFYCATHYSYSAQSNTRYLILNTKDPVIPNDLSTTPLVFDNAIANAAPNLAGWFHHGFTVSAGFEPAEDHTAKAAFHGRVFIQLPIFGSNSFMATGLGGGMGLEFGLSF